MKKMISIIMLMMFLLVGCNMTPTESELIVEQSLNFNFANAIQFYSSPDVSLMAYNNELYFYHNSTVDTEYAGKLSVFSNGEVEEVVDLGEAFILGSYGEYIYYYCDSDSKEYYDDVYCYNLKTKEEKYLTTVKIMKNYSIHWLEDGTVYIPSNYDRDKDADEIEYNVIIGNELRGTIKTEVVYPIGDKLYTIKGHNCGNLYCIDGDERVDLKDEVQPDMKSVLSCDKGLIIHNNGQDELIYLIDNKTQEIKVLFEIDCMDSVSSINIYEDIIFISFKRYEKWGGFPEKLLEYKNDNVQGTYRIDLNDGSATKISDEMYRGLYIWGENVIYAVDFEDQIFQLDFDGNVIEELLVK